MIKKYTYGKPFQTESVVVDIAAEKDSQITAI